MKHTAPNRFYISYRVDLDAVLAQYVTIDEAFYQLGLLSKKHPSWAFVVWNVDEDTKKHRLRAFAEHGVATWAVVCPKCKGTCMRDNQPCAYCDALGATCR